MLFYLCLEPLYKPFYPQIHPHLVHSSKFPKEKTNLLKNILSLESWKEEGFN